MATRDLLAELALLAGRRSLSVSFRAAGGVEVARSIRAGARADLAVLGEDAMAGLEADGLLERGTLRALYVSDVVAAVLQDAPAVSLGSEAELRAAILGAGRIAYSSGPSGKALLELLGSWGLDVAVAPRLVRAEPGRPVASLLVEGDADLGFQQRSELAGVAGVRVLGPLPGAAARRTTFCGAVLAASTHADLARTVLELLGSPDAAASVRAAGMAPV